MGNQEYVVKRKEIEQVYPNTVEEKENMKKPYINKPVPDMYAIIHIDCSWKSEKNTFTAHVDYLKNSLSVTDRTNTPISNRLSLQPRQRPMFFVYASGVKKSPIATMHTKNIWASTSDILL